jgi:FHA domain
MTTQTPSHPTPVGPFTLPSANDRPTGAITPPDADPVIDALPLIDHETRRHTVSAALAPRGHYLALRDGDELRLLPLEAKITHIGRGFDCNVRLDEHRVSRSHAVLVRYGRHFRLLDNRSSNGTYLNGRRVKAANVESGDVLMVGPVELEYVAVD